MPLATLKKVLAAADARQALCLGFVCQGWEDSRAYVRAGEAAGAPVILSAGPGARANMPVSLWGELFRELAKSAAVPVVAHLDHGRTLEECVSAIEAGFSSVMIDGSALALDENIALTNAVTQAAHVRNDLFHRRVLAYHGVTQRGSRDRPRGRRRSCRRSSFE